MMRRVRYLRPVMWLVLLTVGMTARAKDRVYRVEVENPATGSMQTVAIWIPRDIEVLRGAICQLRYPELVERRDYQEFARCQRFALVGGMLEHAGDRGAALTTALTKLAERSGHPEVAHFPLVFSGFSNGGWMAVDLATALPHRTICVQPTAMPGLHHDYYEDEQIAIYRRVPVLQVNGASDGATHRWHEKKHPIARGNRYLWGLAHQWRVKHVYGATNALGWPFIEDAIRLRLSDDADARNGPIELRPIPETSGWLGDTDTWRTEFATIRPFSEAEVKRTANTWLISRRVAYIWRAFVSYRPRMEVRVEGSGSSITLRVADMRPEDDSSNTLRSVEFFAGADRLGEAQKAPFALKTERLEHGVKSVHAICTMEDGARIALRPVLLLDGEIVTRPDE